PVPLRTAYIRTVTHREKDLEQFYANLHSCIYQSSPEDLKKGAPRHRFLLGAASLEDSRVLDMLIADIEARTPEDYTDAETKWHFRYMSRLDLEVHISRAHAATVAGEKLIRRCMDGGIQTIAIGANDEECDNTMLLKSDYLIDPITMYHCAVFHTHYSRNVRPGIAEDNMLTNDVYDMKQHDVSQYRLSRRYGSYSWRHPSGAFRSCGPDEWRCRTCGGRCKRQRCKGQEY
ncbi:hypothetical protein P280DRAFT_374179, partial [Massarina eburnea CBS 473.64]